MSTRPPPTSTIQPPTRHSNPRHHRPPAAPTAHPRSHRTTSTSTTTTSAATEPPPAPARPPARNLAAPHLARRPPAYSTARATVADTAARRDQLRRHPPEGRTSPTAVRNAPLGISAAHFTGRSRSRTGRSGSVAEALHEESDGEVSDSASDNEILIPDSPGATGLTETRSALGMQGRNRDLAAMMDGAVEEMGEWGDEEERVDVQVIEMWKNSKGYSVDMGQVKEALEMSMRWKVEGLAEDGWMFGDVEEDVQM